MLHDPRVMNLSFTGSTEVGRVLLKEASDRVIRCSMELGGNAPFVVLDDANIEEAVKGLMLARCAMVERPVQLQTEFMYIRRLPMNSQPSLPKRCLN